MWDGVIQEDSQQVHPLESSFHSAYEKLERGILGSREMQQNSKNIS